MASLTILISMLVGFSFIIDRIKKLENDKHQIHSLSNKSDRIFNKMSDHEKLLEKQLLNIHLQNEDKLKELLKQVSERKRIVM